MAQKQVRASNLTRKTAFSPSKAKLSKATGAKIPVEGGPSKVLTLPTSSISQSQAAH